MMVTLADEHAVAGREFLEALFEGDQSGVQGGIDLLPLLGQALEELAAEMAVAADVAVALLEGFELGEAVGPRQERLAGVVLGELAVEGDAGFLENIAGVFLV